jgi:hypothetical protein
MTKRARLLAVAIGIVVAATTTGSAATAGDEDGRGGRNSFHNRLSGYEEDPLTFSTPGGGTIRLQINEAQQTITYRLTYANLPTAVAQAHIHFGGPRQSGGVSVFLCTNGTAPVPAPACPAAPATVTGVLTPASVVGPANQGIAAGEFAELVAAIRAGVTYANVHTAERPGGEIRAQIGHHH